MIYTFLCCEFDISSDVRIIVKCDIPSYVRIIICCWVYRRWGRDGDDWGSYGSVVLGYCCWYGMMAWERPVDETSESFRMFKKDAH